MTENKYAHFLKNSRRDMSGNFFVPENILKMGKTFNLVVGNRSSGKSTGILCENCENFLKTGEKFAILRTLRDELNQAKPKIFVKTNSLLFGANEKGVGFDAMGRNNKISFYDGEKDIEAGICIPLTLAQKYKSAAYDDYTRIFYDECVSENGYNYDILEPLQSILSTIIRERENVKVFFAGNNIRCPADILDFIGFDSGKFKNAAEGVYKAQDATATYFISKFVQKKMKQTALGRALARSGSNYAKMALNNNNTVNERAAILDTANNGGKIEVVIFIDGKFFAFKTGNWRGKKGEGKGEYTAAFCPVKAENAGKYCVASELDATPQNRLLSEQQRAVIAAFRGKIAFDCFETYEKYCSVF